MHTYIIVFLLVMIIFSVASSIGFGSGILILPILTYIVGLNHAVQIVVFCSFCAAVLVVSKNHRYIVWKAWLKIVLISGAGMPVGIMLSSMISEYWINLLLSLFVLGVGIRGLYHSYKKPVTGASAINDEAAMQNISSGKKIFHIIILFIGGIVQGSVGVGGPLIVVYASDLIKEKEPFRATMSMTWVLLNGILTIKNVSLAFMNDTSIFTYMLILIPAVAISFIVGNHMHMKLSSNMFGKLVYGLLIVIGIITFATTI